MAATAADMLIYTLIAQRRDGEQDIMMCFLC